MDFSSFMKEEESGAVGEAVTNMVNAERSNFNDDRFFFLTKDKAGNDSAIIRFLPNPDPTKAPFLLRPYHSIKINGKKFFAFCINHITDGKCPSDEHAKPYWDGSEADKKYAGKFYHTKQWICNIQIVKYPANPELEGQVKLMKFGKSIYDKIMSKLSPTDELDVKVDILSFKNGLNFKWKMKQKKKYNNYDDSIFVDTGITPVAETQEGMEEVYNQLNDLTEFMDEKHFKTPEEFANKFNIFLKNSGASNSMVESENKLVVADDTPDGGDKQQEEKEEESLSESKEEDVFDDAGFDDIENDDEELF